MRPTRWKSYWPHQAVFTHPNGGRGEALPTHISWTGVPAHSGTSRSMPNPIPTKRPKKSNQKSKKPQSTQIPLWGGVLGFRTPYTKFGDLTSSFNLLLEGFFFLHYHFHVPLTTLRAFGPRTCHSGGCRFFWPNFRKARGCPSSPPGSGLP